MMQLPLPNLPLADAASPASEGRRRFALAPAFEAMRAAGPHAGLVGDDLRAKAKQAEKWFLKVRWSFAWQRHKEGHDRDAAKAFATSRQAEIMCLFWRGEAIGDALNRLAASMTLRHRAFSENLKGVRAASAYFLPGILHLSPFRRTKTRLSPRLHFIVHRRSQAEGWPP